MKQELDYWSVVGTLNRVLSIAQTELPERIANGNNQAIKEEDQAVLDNVNFMVKNNTVTEIMRRYPYERFKAKQPQSSV